jgi:hypothetical protein
MGPETECTLTLVDPCKLLHCSTRLACISHYYVFFICADRARLWTCMSHPITSFTFSIFYLFYSRMILLFHFILSRHLLIISDISFLGFIYPLILAGIRILSSSDPLLGECYIIVSCNIFDFRSLASSDQSRAAVALTACSCHCRVRTWLQLISRCCALILELGVLISKIWKEGKKGDRVEGVMELRA